MTDFTVHGFVLHALAMLAYVPNYGLFAFTSLVWKRRTMILFASSGETGLNFMFINDSRVNGFDTVKDSKLINVTLITAYDLKRRLSN